MACGQVFQETRKSCVTTQGQHNEIPSQGRDHSHHQIPVEAKQTRVNRPHGWKSSIPNNRDASLTVHFDTRHAQFARSSQQLLRV